MNKNDHCLMSASLNGRMDRKAERVGRRAHARASARGRVERDLRGGGPLTKATERLLAALVAGEEALADPTDQGAIILRKSRSGISVGGGRFRRAEAEALIRHDLARWSGDGPQGLLRATGAGRARHRRQQEGGDTPFLHQHRETALTTVETPAGPTHVRVNAEESPLDWLRRRRDRDGNPLIDEASFQAGERLRADITQAGLLPGVTARWDVTRSGGAASPSEDTDRMVSARQRIRHAFDAVGADFSDLLMDLCGFLKGLELIERERHWPPRSAKVVVRLALARLAEHYGLESQARGPATSRGIRAWQALVIEGGRS
jgi:Domain of unknown function (DUF6456)